MATLNRFYVFTDNLTAAKHDFSAHAYKVMLTSEAPVGANAIKDDITEIAAGNGYVSGGLAIVVSRSNEVGRESIKGSTVVFIAAGGSFELFRYAVLYNDTQMIPAKPLVCWWDYGSAIRLNNGETFTVITAGDAGDVILTLG